MFWYEQVFCQNLHLGIHLRPIFAPFLRYAMQISANTTTADVLRLAQEAGLSTAWFVTLDGALRVSSEALAPIADFIRNSPDYVAHEGLFLEFDAELGAIYGAFVHSTVRGQAQGGTRMRQYDSLADVLTDGMRLAKGMTDKNACAGLWWGGGKGIIATVRNPREIVGAERETLFARYGRFVASLNGAYVTAEDMNTSPEDMRVIHANNRFCTCIPSEIGGSSNPSAATALGVFKGMTATLHFVFGKDATFAGKHIVLQGAGNVGGRLLDHLAAAGARLSVFEPNAATREAFSAKYPESVVKFIEADEVYDTEADIFSPNAIGGILTADTIARLRVKAVAGGANNQLQFPVEDAQRLKARGIAYVPDFIINCMGIVNCANEQYGYIASDIEPQSNNVYDRVLEILEGAANQDITTYAFANQLALQLGAQPHPIFGHRGIRLIKQYVGN